MLYYKEYIKLFILIIGYITGSIVSLYFSESSLIGFFASFFKLGWWAMLLSPFFLKDIYGSVYRRFIICFVASNLILLGYIGSLRGYPQLMTVMGGGSVALFFAVTGSIIADKN